MMPCCRFTVLAPNVLRTDSVEHVFLQADSVSRPIPVTIQVWDFSKTTLLMTTPSELNAANEYHTLLSIWVRLQTGQDLFRTT